MDFLCVKFISLSEFVIGTSAKTLLAIDTQVMRRVLTLTKQQRIDICAVITEEEIVEGLKPIRNDKAPGIDGYNALFFKYTWKIIVKDIIAIIQKKNSPLESCIN